MENHSGNRKDFIQISKAAEDHFRQLLEKEETPGMNLRIFVSQPGLATAEVSVTFCPPGEEQASDIAISFEDYRLYIEAGSETALEGAQIDYIQTALEGQLSIKAPYLKGRAPQSEASLEEKIQFVIDTEINPNLAAHGGHVTLIEVIEEQIIILQFGGGCHGCGMSGITLKNGIEKTLKEKFPQILEIRDITDHTTGSDPYFKSS